MCGEYCCIPSTQYAQHITLLICLTLSLPVFLLRPFSLHHHLLSLPSSSSAPFFLFTTPLRNCHPLPLQAFLSPASLFLLDLSTIPVPSSFTFTLTSPLPFLSLKSILPQIRLSNPSLSSHFFLSAGMKELSPPPLNLRRLYTETLEWEPVLIIISPGADPSQELAELAAETVGRENYHEVKNNGIKWEKS